jgi:hypothetical protein
VLYFADARWWELHRERAEYGAFAGQRVTIENTGMAIADPTVHMLHNYGNERLSDTPNGLHTGSNSGYQSVNLAYLAGASRILLLGYEMHFPQGRSHWHNGHPVGWRVPEENYTMYAGKYKTMQPQLVARGAEVINCTPGSKIKCFPFMPIEDALALI